MSLPASVDVDKATASCKDGLLEITLPKREVVRKQKLTIQSAWALRRSWHSARPSLLRGLDGLG